MRTYGKEKSLKFFFRNRDDHDVDARIEEVHRAMKGMDPTDEKYPKLVTFLDRLHDIKAKTRRVAVKPDTWVIVGAGVLQVLIIVIYEQKHVFTSKAQNMMIRPEKQL